MTRKIIVPSMGESVTEGVIASWLKQDGDFVKNGEALFELETDKVTTEVPAQESGVVRIAVPAGTSVKIGSEVGTIEAGNGREQVQTPSRPAAPAKAAMPGAAAISSAAKLAAASPPPSTGAAGWVDQAPAAPPKIDAPPSVRRKALAGGNKAAIPRAQTAPPPTRLVFQPGQRELRKRMSTLRQRIAERLVQSQRDTATLTTFNEADMTAVMELRERYKENFQQQHGVHLGIMSFFVKAAVAALEAVPEANARLEGNEVVYQNFYDIGIAVSTERGLVVPVLRDADKKSFADIERGIADLAARARDGRIGIEELQGGTFTITNGGVYGSLMSTPILNPPQSAILGMHAIKKRPMVVGDRVEIRPMMYLALSYDHRLIDGRESVTFLVAVKDYIETPGKFLLGLV